MNEISHLHLAFCDFEEAKTWFLEKLDLFPFSLSPEMAVYRFGAIEIAIHPDWGQGDTAFTLALKTDNCKKCYENAVRRGAKARNPPRAKARSINADVFGPGKMVIEFEEGFEDDLKCK